MNNGITKSLAAKHSVVAYLVLYNAM